MNPDEAAARNRRQNRRILLGVGLFAVVAWSAMLCDSRSRPAVTAPERSITAEVSLARSRVEVANRDAFAWTSAKVRLNPGLTGRYDCELGTVRPGETVTVRLDDCTTDGGERFDWQRRKPTAVGVITAQGSKYFQP